jgi:hypothetical protein
MIPLGAIISGGVYLIFLVYFAREISRDPRRPR